MTETVFDLPAPVTIPIVGEAAHFPIHRIFCVGRNYAAHAAEMGSEVDRDAPFYFTKSPASAALAGGTLPYPPQTSDYHHEVELALTIGTPTFEVDAASAQQAIFAYGIALDMTRRDRQAEAKEKRRPWDIGKDVEASAIFAPLTRAAQFGPVADQLLSLKVNGEVRQQGHLSDMIHGCAEIVADLSRFYHLQPGDVILTGTPSGVGPVTRGDLLEATLPGLTPLTVTIA